MDNVLLINVVTGNAYCDLPTKLSDQVLIQHEISQQTTGGFLTVYDVPYGTGNAATRFTPIEIATISRSTNVVTATANAAHGLATGDQIVVEVATSTGNFGPMQVVATVPTTTRFTYAETAGNVTGVGGFVYPINFHLHSTADNDIGMVGIPTGNATAGYSGLVRGVGNAIRLVLSVTDGLHVVRAKRMKVSE